MLFWMVVMVREKLLENIQAGLNEAKKNMSIYPVSRIKWGNETLKDIAKHVEPFKQFSPAELGVLQVALKRYTQNTINGKLSDIADGMLDEVNLILQKSVQ